MIPIRDTAPCHSRPLVTWGIMAICIVVFVTMKLMPDPLSLRLLNLYGMVPIRYTNPYYGLPFDGYLSFLTSLFLHGNWPHLIMNMWFLWIFGDNVEDRMGRLPFLIFYLACGLLATFLQWLFDPNLAIPVVGASGAIAGVLAAYFFLYPLERVVVWIPILFLPIVIHVPAVAFLGLWVLIQLHSATTAMLFGGVAVDVAWWAHLGGFIAGSVLYRLFLRKDPAEKNELF
ncbi:MULTISPECIES: rhomboid family intramembrane serine protease [Methylobacter]|uniref:Membrane associated rhomboid family serine protease n=1 Tax=Methylobacter tundripaludum TaxID=173365 RepID=A0A2S6HFL3_9GAMM|nr:MULTISPECIES: rhomboid family intramembrane serine protease [Methylobacter]MDI1276952.1 rhomboid family intramembrane serine protease [Methylobacter sp.]MDI1357586.1 rhomboid family intramembrane serine protease [Methylobacter sp.]PPK76252.1 membrane associated rhomboid family serine protease [Methylobacter tundripaludum]